MAFQDPYRGLPSPDRSLESSRGTDRASTQEIPNAANIGAPNNSLTMPRNLETTISADKSWGTLFAGLGEAAKDAVGVADNVIKKSISEDLYKGIDNIRDSFGVADATVQAQTGGLQIAQLGAEGTTPVAINKLGNQVQGLTDAYNAGKLSDSYYSARLESFVRDMREQYPGYRDVIDEKVSTIVGGTPANMLRKALLNDVTELQKKYQAAQDKFGAFETSKAEFLPADYWDRKMGNSNLPAYSQQETKAFVASRERKQQEVKEAKEQLSLEVEGQKVATGRNADLKDKAERAGVTSLNTLVSNIMADTSDKLGVGTVPQLQAKVQEWNKTGGGPTAQEKPIIAGQLATLKQTVLSQVLQELNKPLTEGSSASLVSTINDPERVKKMVDQAMIPITDLENAVGTQNWNLFAMHSNISKAMTDQKTSQMLQKFDIFTTWKSLRETIGDQGVAVYLGSPKSPLQESTLSALRDLDKGEVGLGTSKGVQDQINRKKEITRDPAAMRATINDPIDVLTDPDKQSLPVSMRVNSAMHLYAENNGQPLLQEFKPNERKDVYYQMTSPRVTEAMTQLRHDNPESWLAYKKWGVQNFYNVFKDAGDSIQEGVDTRRFITVKYDPDSKQFNVEPTEEGKKRLLTETGVNPIIKNGGQGVVVNALETMLSARIKKPIDDMNQALKNLDTIYKADNQDLNKAMPVILKTMGIDLNAAKKDTAWGWIVNATKAATEEDQSAQPKTVTQAEPGNHFQQADSELNLNPQEKALYQRHLSNLTGAGGVDNADGSRSSLYQAVQEHDGKFYNIPTVWDGKREVEKYTTKDGRVMDVPNAQALKNVAKVGWDKFPSYDTPDEADARYEQMHQFMERDTQDYLRKKGQTISDSTTPLKATDYSHLDIENLPVEALPKINKENWDKFIESQTPSTNIDDRRDMPFEFSAPNVARAIQNPNTFKKFVFDKKMTADDILTLRDGLKQAEVDVPPDVLKLISELEDQTTLTTMKAMKEHMPETIPYSKIKEIKSKKK